jgi:fumarate hydratase class II
MEDKVMQRQLLVIAALSTAIGFSAAAANAAPATSMFETLKASASESSAVQQVRVYRRGYHHHHHHQKNCWWGDRWVCSWLW